MISNFPYITKKAILLTKLALVNLKEVKSIANYVVLVQVLYLFSNITKVLDFLWKILTSAAHKGCVSYKFFKQAISVTPFIICAADFKQEGIFLLHPIRNQCQKCLDWINRFAHFLSIGKSVINFQTAVTYLK